MLDFLLGMRSVYDYLRGGSLLWFSFFGILLALMAAMFLTDLLETEEDAGFWVNIAGEILFVFLVVILGLRIFGRFYLVWRRVRSRKYSTYLTNEQTKILQSSIYTEMQLAINPRSRFLSEDRDAGLNKPKIGLIEKQDAWQLYDIYFTMYRTYRGSEYTHRTVCYTVLEITLPRLVPQVLFDSKLGKGRQFQRLYLPEQSLNLDGLSQEAFAAYSPVNYDIDALSFITPEVIEAALNMHRYDFEFIDNKLLCYAPLLKKSQLPDFKNRGLNLYQQVSHNLKTYRDYRTSDKASVTEFGARLLRNPAVYLWMAIGWGLFGLSLLAGLIGVLIKIDTWSWDLVILATAGIAGCISSSVIYIKIRRTNAKKLQNFLEKSKKLKEQNLVQS